MEQTTKAGVSWSTASKFAACVQTQEVFKMRRNSFHNFLNDKVIIHVCQLCNLQIVVMPSCLQPFDFRAFPPCSLKLCLCRLTHLITTCSFARALFSRNSCDSVKSLSTMFDVDTANPCSCHSNTNVSRSLSIGSNSDGLPLAILFAPGLRLLISFKFTVHSSRYCCFRDDIQ
jgi:hypothetical protein